MALCLPRARTGLGTLEEAERSRSNTNLESRLPLPLRSSSSENRCLTSLGGTTAAIIPRRTPHGALPLAPWVLPGALSGEVGAGFLAPLQTVCVAWGRPPPHSYLSFLVRTMRL